ncbi:MAG: sulfatase-like hydrolase/transferase [Planctomycetes bacterium]|nr:sulfatase-like hydrolase/transferase [Planctomycetota bacterium]
MTRAERAAYFAALRLAAVVVAVLAAAVWLLIEGAPDFHVARVLALTPANEVDRSPGLMAGGVRRDAWVLAAGETARFHVTVPGDEAVLRFREFALRAYPDVSVRVLREDGERSEVASLTSTEGGWGVHRVPLGVDAGEQLDVELVALDGRSRPGFATLALSDVVLESDGRAVDESQHPVLGRVLRDDLLASLALEMTAAPRTVESARVDAPGPGVLPLDEHAARSLDLEAYGPDARVHLVVHAAQIAPDTPVHAGTVRVSQGEVLLGAVPVVLRPPRTEQEWLAEFDLGPSDEPSTLRLELLGTENLQVGLREAYVTVPDSHVRRPFDPDTSVNVLLVVVEGLRADRLGCYGDERARTPVLDGLARRGVRYTDLVTPSSWTLPNVASLFTGVSPVAHGVGLDDGRVLSPRAVTLARSASWSGVTTACFASSATVTPESGLLLGMETVRSGSSGAPEIVEAFDDWLVDAAQFEWFATLVLDDPLPPHETFVVDVEGRDLDPDPALVERLRPLDPRPGAAETMAFEMGPSYEGEVTRVDRALGALFDSLAARDLLDHTLVCVVGAYGLETYEHGGLLAGRTLFDEVVRVPLILAGPRVLGVDPPPVVEREPIELVDVTALLAELGRLSTSGVRSGRVPPPYGPREPGTTRHGILRPVTDVTRSDLESSRRGQWLRIHDRLSDTVSLFDLSVDPGAQVDLLAGDDPVAVAQAAAVSGGLASAFESWYLDELSRSLSRPVPVGR